MDTIGALTSMALQYGVPLESLTKKFAHQRFEPSGFTRNPDIRNASSIIDYVFRWMACQFIPGYREQTAPSAQPELNMPGLEEAEKKTINRPVADLPLSEEAEAISVNAVLSIRTALNAPKSIGTSRAAIYSSTFVNQHDAPSCPNCGHIAVRNGACYKCMNCGESLGCS